MHACTQFLSCSYEEGGGRPIMIRGWSGCPSGAGALYTMETSTRVAPVYYYDDHPSWWTTITNSPTLPDDNEANLAPISPLYTLVRVVHRVSSTEEHILTPYSRLYMPLEHTVVGCSFGYQHNLLLRTIALVTISGLDSQVTTFLLTNRFGDFLWKLLPERGECGLWERQAVNVYNVMKYSQVWEFRFPYHSVSEW